MLDQAKAKKEREPDVWSNVQLHLHDITKIDEIAGVEENSFDVITCASALVLLSDPQAAVNLWTRFLKSGGKLITDVPHPSNLIDGMVIERVGRRLEMPVPYNRAWVTGEESLPQLLRAAGLEVEKCISMAQTGQGTQYYELSDADNVFISKVIMSESARHLRAPEVRDKARKIFKEEWLRVADDNDKIAEVDSVYVAMAIKP
jgi:ubiquinone/menaquinone biosynthesis C-methylase UbiE